MTGSDLIIVLKKNPVGVACGVIALLCGAAYFVRTDTLEEKKQKVADAIKQRDVMVANVRNAAGLVHQTDSLIQETKQLESRLVKANQLATNLQYFYRLESDTGVKLTDVRQNQVGRANAGLFIGIPYTVTFQGTFRQALEFLQKIESGKHLSKYSSISFNKATGAESTGGILSVSMNIELLGTP